MGRLDGVKDLAARIRLGDEEHLRRCLRLAVRGNKPNATQLAKGADPRGEYDLSALARFAIQGDAIIGPDVLLDAKDDEIWRLRVQVAHLYAIWEAVEAPDAEWWSVEGFENLVFTLIQRGLPGSGARFEQRWVTKRLFDLFYGDAHCREYLSWKKDSKQLARLAKQEAEEAERMQTEGVSPLTPFAAAGIALLLLLVDSNCARSSSEALLAFQKVLVTGHEMFIDELHVSAGVKLLHFLGGELVDNHVEVEPQTDAPARTPRSEKERLAEMSGMLNLHDPLARDLIARSMWNTWCSDDHAANLDRGFRPYVDMMESLRSEGMVVPHMWLQMPPVLYDWNFNIEYTMDLACENEFCGVNYSLENQSSWCNEAIHADQSRLARVFILPDGRSVTDVCKELWPRIWKTMVAITLMMNDPTFDWSHATRKPPMEEKPRAVEVPDDERERLEMQWKWKELRDRDFDFDAFVSELDSSTSDAATSVEQRVRLIRLPVADAFGDRASLPDILRDRLSSGSSIATAIAAFNDAMNTHWLKLERADKGQRVLAEVHGGDEVKGDHAELVAVLQGDGDLRYEVRGLEDRGLGVLLARRAPVSRHQRQDERRVGSPPRRSRPRDPRRGCTGSRAGGTATVSEA